MQQDLLQTLRWIRTFGDVVFIIGAAATALQVVIALRQPAEKLKEAFEITG